MLNSAHTKVVRRIFVACLAFALATIPTGSFAGGYPYEKSQRKKYSRCTAANPNSGMHGTNPAVASAIGAATSVQNTPGQATNSATQNDANVDPIHLFSGEFYEDAVDASVPGRGMDFILSRSYRSRLVPDVTTNYCGWEMGYDVRIIRAAPTRIVLVEGGTADEFISGCDPGFTGLVGYYQYEPTGGCYRRYHEYSVWCDSCSPPQYVTERDYDCEGPTDTPHVYELPGSGLQLVENCGLGVSAHFSGGGKWTFGALGPVGSTARLLSIETRTGDTITFTHDSNGRIATATDTMGRGYNFAYYSEGSRSGLLWKVTRVADGGTLAEYDYYGPNEAQGPEDYLKSATNANSETVTYTYSTGNTQAALNGNLLTITDAKSQKYLTNLYAHELPSLYPDATSPTDPAFDRVVRQIWGNHPSGGDPGDTVDLFYVGTQDMVSKTILRDRNGHVTEYDWDADDECIAKRVFTGTAPDPAARVTETANRPANPVRSADPACYQWTYQWNNRGRITQATLPDQSTIGFIYEKDLNDNAPWSIADNLRRVDRNAGNAPPPPGESWSQTLMQEHFAYDASGGGCCGTNRVNSYTDPHDNTTTMTYDALGQVTGIGYPDGSSEAWEYYTTPDQARTQLMKHTWPKNGENHTGAARVDEFLYHADAASRANCGYLHKMIIDAENPDQSKRIIVEFADYDANGNPRTIIDPRRNDTQVSYDPVGRVTDVLSRIPKNGDRYHERYLYDLNGNVREVQVANKDDQGQVSPSGAPTTYTTTISYDILNYPTVVHSDNAAPGETAGIGREFQYDRNRNLTKVLYGQALAGGSQQPNNTLSVAYDERNLPWRVMKAAGDADESTAVLSYDAAGRLSRIVRNPGGATQPETTVVSDPFGRRHSVTDPMGNVARYDYSLANRTIRRIMYGELTDVAGSAGNARLAEVTGTLDTRNRIARIEAALFNPATQAAIGDGSAVTQVFYNDNSQVKRVVNDNNHTVTVAYDTANRPLSVTDAVGNSTTVQYDCNSNVTQRMLVEKVPSAADQTFIATYEYDRLDRLITQSVTVPGATYPNVTDYGYDSRDNLTYLSDARRASASAAGNVSQFEYDGMDRLTRAVLQLTSTGEGGGTALDPVVISQSWDRSSRLTRQVDGRGNATNYQYDPLNRLKKIVYADTTEENYTYDPLNNLTQWTDANGTVVAGSFDLRGRPAGRTVTPGSPATGDTALEEFRFDGASRLVYARNQNSAQNQSSVVTRAYDSLSRAISDTFQIDNGPVRTVTAGFDGVGNRLTLGYPSGRTATASFDSLERIATLTEGGQSVASFAYAGRGRLASVIWGGSLAKQSWSYNGVTGVNNAAGDFGVGLPTAANTIALQNSATLDSQAFSWDRGQNKRTMSDSAPGLTALTRTNAYDSLSRLTATAGTAYGAGAQVSLDAANNRVSVTGGLHPGNYSMNAAVPPADSQMNQYSTTPMGAATHDATGNLASLPDPLGAWGMTATALYDYAGRMVNWTAGTGAGQRAVSYRYDALGRLLRRQEQSGVQTVEVTDFAYAGWQLAEERRNTVPTGQTAVMTYLYGGGLDQLVASRKDSEPLTFYAADDQGSIVMAGTAAAGVVERYSYDDFGRPQVLAPNGTPRTASLIGNRVLYTGRWLDPVAGLYSYRTRWMSPELGRFTTRDTIGIWGDGANLGNGTAYVGNDPWNWVDPWGEKPLHCDWYNPADWLKYYLGQPEIGDFVSEMWATEYAMLTGGVNGSIYGQIYSMPGVSADSKDYAAATVDVAVEAALQAALTALTAGLAEWFGAGAASQNACNAAKTTCRIGNLVEQAGESAARSPSWRIGANKTVSKIASQMKARGWTADQITEAIAKGKKFSAPNFVNPRNSATRYVHPQTGRSVVLDDLTQEVLHVGGDGFLY